LPAERIHVDDTTVPVMAKGKTRTVRLWTYVRYDHRTRALIRVFDNQV
jgi:transposase